MENELAGPWERVDVESPTLPHFTFADPRPSAQAPGALVLFKVDFDQSAGMLSSHEVLDLPQLCDQGGFVHFASPCAGGDRGGDGGDILSHLPGQESKSRIKRMRGYSRPAWRLRVGGYRVFYSIEGDVVEIVGIVAKDAANLWLEEHGKP